MRDRQRLPSSAGELGGRVRIGSRSKELKLKVRSPIVLKIELEIKTKDGYIKNNP
jgi:hypothetical protein